MSVVWRASVTGSVQCAPSGDARSRSRTGTGLPPRDFKSLASTCSATRACKEGKFTCCVLRRAKQNLSRCGGWSRNRTGVHGFAGRCITTLPPSRSGAARFSRARKRKTPTGRRGCYDQGIWSGKRDSNSRPQPWQGCALPTELFPLAWTVLFMPPPGVSSALEHFAEQSVARIFCYSFAAFRRGQAATR